MARKNLNAQYPPRSGIICEKFKILRLGLLHGSQPEKAFVIVRFRNPNLALDTEVEIPLSAARSSELKKYIPEAFFLEDVPMDRQHKEIAKRLNQGLSHAIPFTLLPQGYTYTDDRWYYVIGDQIIGDSHRRYYPHNPLNFKVTDQSQSNADWSEWLKTYTKQGPDKVALLLCALSPFIRPITEGMHLPSNAVNAYCVGPSGVGKTSFAKLVCPTWGAHQLPGINLASDQANICSALQHYVDLPCLIDDLNRSASDREQESKTKKLSQLIAASESGGALITKNVQLDVRRTALICTAEFELPNPSTLNRCILIRCDSPFDHDALTYLQKNASMFQLLVLDFVKWICQNHEQLIEAIEGFLKRGEFDYRDAHGNPNEYYGYDRVVNNNKLLRITALLLVSFFQASTSEKCQKLYERMTNGVKKSVADTLEAVKKEPSISDTLIVLARVFAYDPDEVVAGSSDDRLDKKLFFRWNNYVYFAGEDVITYISGKLGRVVTQKSFSGELSGAHLLEPSGKENTSRLPKPLIAILNSSGRHYRLKVPALCDLVLSIHSRFETMHSPLWELRANPKRDQPRYKDDEKEDYSSSSW